jgi:hypothetical protein
LPNLICPLTWTYAGQYSEDSSRSVDNGDLLSVNLPLVVLNESLEKETAGFKTGHQTRVDLSIPVPNQKSRRVAGSQLFSSRPRRYHTYYT